MSRQNTVVEMRSSGAINEAKRRWRYITLMVLTVHTFLISTCLTLIFTNLRFSAEEPTESTNTILLRLENKGVTKPDASNSNLVLLEFRTVPREIPNLKVENKTVITIICRGPYILYPYIEDPDEDMNPIASAFNITVISEQKKVLALIPFNTTDKTTWQSRILNLDENERISVYVDCIEPSCQYVGALCLGLHFMLGSVCLSDLPNIAT